MSDLPSKKSAGDAAYEVGRAIVAAVPAVGGPLQVLFENVFEAPLEKRREVWMNELGAAIEELLERVEGLDAHALGENAAFVTTAIQATQIALRNHQRAKLDALRNAVLNSGLPGAPSDDLQAIFTRLVDELTPWHLRLLVFLDDPERALRESGAPHPEWTMGSTATVLETAIPEIASQREVYDQMVSDLQSVGLVSQGSFMHATMTAQGMVASRTTGLGRQFIAFITTPESADIYQAHQPDAHKRVSYVGGRSRASYAQTL